MHEIDKSEFELLPLRVHSFLAGIPLRTLYRIDLPGGREGMSLQEISDITGFSGAGKIEVGPITQALFDLRGWIGRMLGWDEVPALAESVSFAPRLSDEDRARTRVKAGTVAGISRVLYSFENEMLAEIINRTVHCFYGIASERTATGYALYMAIYVRRISWITPIYMALITPMVKWIVYPSMINGARRKWARAFPIEKGSDLGMPLGA